MPDPLIQTQLLCPNCGGEITNATVICPHCGLQVPPNVMASPYDRNANKRQWASNAPNSRLIWLGILAANLCGFVMVLLSRWIVSLNSTGPAAPIFIASDFTLVPICMGLVTAYFWRNQNLTHIQTFSYSSLNGLFMLFVGGFLFLQEGGLCLLMAAPLLLVIVWIGALLGKLIFPNTNNRVQVSLIPIAFCLIVWDSLTPHHYVSHETDTIIVHATPAQVWRYIPDYPKITEKPTYWLFRMGLPAPVIATTTGHFIGADRKCVFSQNDVFDEKIVEMEPSHKLTFDIVSQPKDPEIIGHLRIERGQFILKDNGNGTTTVTGTSWYQLNVFPICYYDLWTQNIISHVHLRAMNHIKRLAEARQ